MSEISERNQEEEEEEDRSVEEGDEMEAWILISATDFTSWIEWNWATG